MPRKNVTYNQPLEKDIGFSRAVRIGNIIAVPEWLIEIEADAVC